MQVKRRLAYHQVYPPLTLSDEDCRWLVTAVKDVVADAHRLPGAAWEFGKTLASQAIRQKTAQK
jgi:ornithine--oxo-acid transaminase